MAVINTVLPQEDELLISLIHRTAEKNGIDIDYFLKEYLFDDKHESMPSNRELGRLRPQTAMLPNLPML